MPAPFSGTQYLETFFQAGFLLYRVDDPMEDVGALVGVLHCNNDTKCRVVCSPAVVRWETDR